jgi:hypothetical protein
MSNDAGNNDVADLPEELVIDLRKPVTLGGESWSTLVLREPTGAEWIEFGKTPGVEGNIKAIALISGVPLPAVKMVGVRDLKRGTEYLDRFF